MSNAAYRKKLKRIVIAGERKYAHRAILEAHLGRPLLTREHVHHLNGDPSDNRIENLQIVSPAEHRRLHQTGVSRSEDVKAKISKALMGVPKSEACRLALAKELLNPNSRKRMSLMKPGERHLLAKLTAAEVLEIRRLCSSGVRHAEVAGMFGVGSGAISHIHTRRTWKHL